MADYITCELIGGVSPRHLNTFSNLFIVGCTLHTSINTHYVLLTTPMCTMLAPTKDLNIPYLVAILDCTHIGFATARPGERTQQIKWLN